jgi:hypothetical protein
MSNKVYTKEEIRVLFGQARTGKLPEGFNDWRLRDVYSIPIAIAAALANKLPADFGCTDPLLWEIQEGFGGPRVAHIAVEHGPLPAYFNKWDIANYQKCSVAHVAAVYGYLPKDFNRWDISDDNGITIAHVAADNNHLPDNFGKDNPRLWGLFDNKGWTVAHIAAQRGLLPNDFGKHHPYLWKMRNEHDDTVAHIAARHTVLPEYFMDWDMTNTVGETVRDTAVGHGTARP